VIITTPRMVVRILDESHLHTLVDYRNHPDVALMQDWELPYTLERARQRLAAQQHLTGPAPGEAMNLAIEVDGVMVGDLFCGIAEHGAIAEIGYSLIPEHQGKGYASEAAGALVDLLFDTTSVHRITASLDPLNDASIRLLERLGFQREGIARLGLLIRGEWVDDLIYSLLRSDWSASRRLG
jgi:RimJ/RimL family protein N-acetyltransferase